MKVTTYFFILLTLFFNSCDGNDDPANNPYDPQTPPDLWAPKNLIISQIDSVIELSWEQDIINIDGFKIDREKDYEGWLIGIGQVDKYTNKWYDNSFLANPRYIYRYRIYAFAGSNLSTSQSGEIRPTEVKKTFIDPRDGETYKYITIGSQIWMAENLNYKSTSGSWCYEDKQDYCNNYGCLYDFYTAISVCPVGWHLPSDEEWKTLERFLGMSEVELNYLGATLSRTSGEVGLKLVPYLPGIGNEEACGFDAQWGGIRLPDGRFNNIGWHAYYWSSDQIYRQLIGHNKYVYRANIDYKYGLSVRCIKNN